VDGAGDNEPSARSRCHRSPYPKKARVITDDVPDLALREPSTGSTGEPSRRDVKPPPDEED
jgi:hypothetical protein